MRASPLNSHGKKKCSASLHLISFWFLSHDHLLPGTESQLFQVRKDPPPLPFRGSHRVLAIVSFDQASPRVYAFLFSLSPAKGKTKQSPNLVLLLISQWGKAFQEWEGRSQSFSGHSKDKSPPLPHCFFCRNPWNNSYSGNFKPRRDGNILKMRPF